MQTKSGLKWQSIGLLVVMFTAALLISVNLTSPVEAQGLTPTATPLDPAWRGFSAARDAIEEERGVDLTTVRNWEFVQTEYTNGIDFGCVDGIAESEVREVYFGWIFTITDLFGVQYQARVAFDLSAVAVCDQVTQSSAAPAPAEGAAPDPNLPAPVAGSGATGSFELGGHVDGLGPNTVANMQTAGMTWVKKQLRYNLGDSGSIAQGMISDASGKGFKILLGIVGNPAQMGDYESYIQSYAQFVGEVAALNPNAIEIWNEPNLDREWPNGQIDGARYTQLLAASYNAIKTANPNVMVISGAPAPTGAEAAFPGAVVNDDNFMNQMAAAGAAQYMDCVGLHYNEGIVAPSRSSGDPRGDFPTRYYGTMAARGNIFGKPLCWTELGYLSGEGMGAAIPPLFAWAEGVTVAQQAAWLAEAASIAAQSGNVRLMIVWNVNFTRWDSDPMGGYAMMRPDGTCPACTTLGTVMRG